MRSLSYTRFQGRPVYTTTLPPPSANNVKAFLSYFQSLTAHNKWHTDVNTVAAKLNLIWLRKVVFIAGLLHWIALPCTVIHDILSTSPTVCCRAATDLITQALHSYQCTLKLAKYRKKFSKEHERSGAPTFLCKKQLRLTFPQCVYHKSST